MISEIIIGFCFFGMSIVFIWGAKNFPSPPSYSVIGSSTLPTGIAITMAICSLVVIGRTIKNFKLKTNVLDEKAINQQGIIAIGIAIVFLIVFPYVGFLVSSTFILVSYALLLQAKKEKKFFDTLIMPLVYVLLIFFLFKFLNIYLPIGKLFYKFFY